MCTIIVLYGVRRDFPVVLATNRDEFYARPATGPVRLLAEPSAVGGVDLQAGGSWSGVTAEGFFVGVTNQRSFAPRPAQALSRGQLVMDVLRAGEPEAARVQVAGVDARRYQPFNLLFGNSERMWLAYGRPEAKSVSFERLTPGLHVLPNDVLDSADFPKCARAKALLEPHLHAPWQALEAALMGTLADEHTTAQAPPVGAPATFDAEMMRKLSALAVRTPAYGSRSSTVVALEPGRCAHYLYADGRPGEAPFEDVTAHFHHPPFDHSTHAADGHSAGRDPDNRG